MKSIFKAVVSCSVALVLATSIDAASDAIVESKKAPESGKVVRVELGEGRVFETELLNKPPTQPRKIIEDRDEQERDGQLKEPFIVTSDEVSFSPVAETDSRNRSQAPETFTLLRESTTGPQIGGNGSISTVSEPSIASKGLNIFETYNWYSAVSTNNGETRRFISPYLAFPRDTPPFTAGFCCDQRATQASNKGLVFWFLQYIKNGTTATSTGGVRLAVAKDSAISSDPIPWQTYDFFPEQINLTGTWYDFPHMQVSNNFVYFTSNLFTTAADSFAGSVIYRIPLAAIIANQPVVAETFFTTQFGSILAVNGSGGEGSRPAKNVMYFASVSGSNAVRVIKWPEADAQPTVTVLSGLTTTAAGTFSCPVTIGGAAAVNPCGRANTRMQSGWVSDTELGLMWVSNTIAPSRPFPFTRVLIVNPDTLSIISQPDIFSTANALLYPAIAVNQRGHLGGVIDSLGGDQSTTLRAFIRDDLSPDVVTSGWETFTASLGNNAANAWGDYNGIAAHQRFSNTWVGIGHNQIGAANGTGSRLRSIWFARERDASAAVNAGYTGTGTATITSVPAGVTCVAGNAAGCSSNYPLGTSVTLSIASATGTGFFGWTGACSGELSTCTVTTDQLQSVRAKIADGVIFNSGFEDR